MSPFGLEIMQAAPNEEEAERTDQSIGSISFATTLFLRKGINK